MALISVFQDFKKIYGICPCCGDPFRLSEATLSVRSSPLKTPFDKLEDDRKAVERAREHLDSLSFRLQDKARQKGKKLAQFRLRAFSAFFARRKLDLRDVKVLFDPVDYVVFRNLCDDLCSEIVFVDREPDTMRREKVQSSLERALRRGNVEWKTIRIADNRTITIE